MCLWLDGFVFLAGDLASFVTLLSCLILLAQAKLFFSVTKLPVCASKDSLFWLQELKCC